MRQTKTKPINELGLEKTTRTRTGFFGLGVWFHCVFILWWGALGAWFTDGASTLYERFS